MIDCVITGNLEENCYILYNDDDDKCILIDPGSDADLIEEECLKLGKTPTHILITHGHFDHIGAAKHFQDKGAKVYVHEYDAYKLEYDRVAVMLGCGDVEWLKADVILHDKDVIEINGYVIDVIHTPGHSVGAVCYVIDSEKCIFTGDTVFFRSYGRCDFPTDGNFNDIKDSFRTLYALKGKDDYIIYPGHGISTTLGDEKKYNAINSSL